MREIKIDFDNPGFPQRLDVVENDAQSRFFKAVLYKDGKAYAAPSGATYSIMYRGFGPQNEGWYDTINDGSGKRAACSVSGNVVTCEIARQALRVPGHVSVVLCVTGSNGYMLHGWPIDCNCRNDSYTGGTSVESFFYITQVTNADWTAAIRTWEELKNMIDPTLSLSGKAADAAKVGEAVGELKEDLVTTQKAYLTNPKIENNLYIKDDCTILGYDGWDMLSIPVISGDKIIVYSPVDSKYNAMYSTDLAKYKNFVLKNGMNYIDIPDGYRDLKISNEREIAKNVRFFVLPTQAINNNNEKMKIADRGCFLFDIIPHSYIYDADGSERYSQNYDSTDYIDLSGHKNFVVICEEGSQYNALYDNSYNFLCAIDIKSGCTNIDEIPDGAKYLRISHKREQLKNVKIIFDNSLYYKSFDVYGSTLPRSNRWWEYSREIIIREAYDKLLANYKENPDIIPLFVCTDSHRWSPQHPQRYVNNIDVDGMEIANINLGDDVVQYWADGKFDMIYNSIRYVKNYIGVCGNHDKMYGTSTTEYFLRRIFTSKNAEYIGKSKRCCYSVKDGLHDVKYIIFDPYYAPNSGVPMVSIPTSVARWVICELSKNDGYDIIFLNHQPLTDNNIHRDGTKQSWKMEPYEVPIFSALFNVLKDRKNKRKGTYTDTDGIAHQYDFSQCENDLLCLLHGHSHEELYYIEDGLTSYVCDWDGAESTGYKSTFIAIDRSKETLTAWIAKGSENVEPALELKIS